MEYRTSRWLMRGQRSVGIHRPCVVSRALTVLPEEDQGKCRHEGQEESGGERA